MSYLQFTFGYGYTSYWPHGENYTLTPKWRELHTDTDSTVDPDEEANRADLVGDYGAEEIFFIVQLRDMSDPKNPVAPDEEPDIQSVLTIDSDGWMRQSSFEMELIDEEVDPDFPDEEPVWSGDIKLTLTDEAKSMLGVGRIANYKIDAVFPSEAPERRRVSYGTLVLRA